MTGLSLRFLSGKYQGGEFPLPPDREIVVGRSSELDMVLAEDMVSRKHAKIGAGPGGLMIQDLGSTNGTFVNGEKVKKARLREGDRILIGTSILKVVASDGRMVTASEAQRQLEEVGAQTRQMAMEGTLDEVPVPDLLQLFATSKRNGVLAMSSERGRGKVYLREGNVFYACINDDHELGPMKALCRMVGWTSGQFQFGPPESDADFMLELEDTTENLLMKAMHQLDELRRLQPDLPGDDALLSLSKSVMPLWSSLDPVELDVLQLVYVHRSPRLVFDRCPSTDYEAGSALLRLISQGYVRSD